MTTSIVTIVCLAPLCASLQYVRLLHVGAVGNPRLLGMSAIANWSAHYHNRQKLLPSGYRFDVQHVSHHYPQHGDAGKSAARVLKELLQYRGGEEAAEGRCDERKRRFDAIIGLPYSGVAKVLCQLTPHFDVVSISCCAGAPELSEKKIYPSFVRAIGPNNNKVYGALAVLEDLKYTRVLLVVDKHFGSSIAPKIRSTFDKRIEILAQVEIVPTEASAEERERSIGDALKTIRNTEARILLIATSSHVGALLICRAYREGVATPQTHLWIALQNQNALWLSPSHNPILLDDESCDVTTLRQAYRGMLQMADPSETDVFVELASPLGKGHNVSWFLDEIGQLDGVQVSAHLDCAMALFDTFTAVALAIRHGELEHRLATEQQPNGTAVMPFWPPAASTLHQLIVKTQAMGLNTPIVFDEGGDRESAVYVRQMNLSTTGTARTGESVGLFSNVAKAQPPHYVLKWHYNLPQLDFGTPDGRPPRDHPSGI